MRREIEKLLVRWWFDFQQWSVMPWPLLLFVPHYWYLILSLTTFFSSSYSLFKSELRAIPFSQNFFSRCSLVVGVWLSNPTRDCALITGLSFQMWVHVICDSVILERGGWGCIFIFSGMIRVFSFVSGRFCLDLECVLFWCLNLESCINDDACYW